MTVRSRAGAIAAFVYNALISPLPSRKLRHAYLKVWLGGMGPGTGVQRGCKFLNARKIHFGARAVVNFGCVFDGRHYHIVTGDDVSIGPEAAVLTLGHDPNAADFALKGGDVKIGDRVWIGFRAIILPGVQIGEGAVVAAGAVVSRDVPPFQIVAGSPARVVGERSRELSYKLAYRPWLS